MCFASCKLTRPSDSCHRQGLAALPPGQGTARGRMSLPDAESKLQCETGRPMSAATSGSSRAQWGRIWAARGYRRRGGRELLTKFLMASLIDVCHLHTRLREHTWGRHARLRNAGPPIRPRACGAPGARRGGAKAGQKSALLGRQKSTPAPHGLRRERARTMAEAAAAAAAAGGGRPHVGLASGTVWPVGLRCHWGVDPTAVSYTVLPSTYLNRLR